MVNLMRFSCTGGTAVKSFALLGFKEGLVANITLTDKLGAEPGFIRKGSAKLLRKNNMKEIQGCGGHELTVFQGKTTVYNKYGTITEDVPPDDNSYKMQYINQMILDTGAEWQQKTMNVLSKNTIYLFAKGSYYE